MTNSIAFPIAVTACLLGCLMGMVMLALGFGFAFDKTSVWTDSAEAFILFGGVLLSIGLLSIFVLGVTFVWKRTRRH